MRKLSLTLVAGIAVALMGSSCTTMYDAHGRPRQVVTPEGAALGAVAAGVVGYALADGKSRDRHYYHPRRHRRPWRGYCY